MSNDFSRLPVEYPANYQDKRMLDVKFSCPYSMLDIANKLIKKHSSLEIILPQHRKILFNLEEIQSIS